MKDRWNLYGQNNLQNKQQTQIWKVNISSAKSGITSKSISKLVD
jgi:hypothetical protein